MKKFLLGVAIALTTTSALADCQCGATSPFVHWLPVGTGELDETPWRLVGVEAGYDLMLEGEPLRCFVELEAIPFDDPILYEGPFQEVPTGDFEVHFTGSWMLASEVEAVLRDTECLSLM